MALEFNQTKNTNKVPITRNNKFFGSEDFDLEIGFATEYIEQDANQTVILYQVDLEKTKIDDIYNEAKKDAIRFKTPIVLPVIYEVSDAETKAYNNKIQTGYYAKTGKLTFSVLLSTLEENNCDIVRGDYIGVQIDTDKREYFTVIDDGRVNMTSNKFTIYGTKPYARQIVAVSIDSNEFNG